MLSKIEPSLSYSILCRVQVAVIGFSNLGCVVQSANLNHYQIRIKYKIEQENDSITNITSSLPALKRK